MLSIVLAVAVLGAEPKAVSGSEYYLEAVETLDRCRSDKETSAAVVRLNKKWSKRRIVVEFQIEKVINNIAYLHSLEKEGDWRTYFFQSWLPKRGSPGDTIKITGSPVIGPTKPENEIGTIHAGGKSIKYRVDLAKIDHRPGGG